MRNLNISNGTEEKNECCGNDCCGEENICCDNCAPKIGHLAPSFTAEIYHHDQSKKIKLSDYKGKWVILFFYPADFTFVCPTELGDVADHYQEIKNLNTEMRIAAQDLNFELAAQIRDRIREMTP